jgi:dihydroorotate dehydrogenase electron transfer subunit
MRKQIAELIVVENTPLNLKHNLLKLKSPSPLPDMTPGQFVEVKVDGSESTYLRRPFSIHRVDYDENTIHLLIKVVGKGTMSLSALKTGDTVNVMFPLGKGFSITKDNEVLLVGGGCGVAPLYFLAEQLHKNGNKVNIIIGGKTAEDILLHHQYKAYGNVFISTEDGSLGEKGMVTTHSIFSAKPIFDKIYCCGPDGMMRAVSHYAEKHRIPCEVSLENTMACGIGACLCCVVESVQGNVCVCTEGPVFESSTLKGWTVEDEIGCSLDQ